MKRAGRIAALSVAVLAAAIASPKAMEACNGPVGGNEGNCAPDFALPSVEGPKLSLASYRGKVVLLNFWATWCEPCRTEIPSMEHLQGTLPADRFVVLAVSIDSEGVKAIDRFFKGKKPPFPILLDRDQTVSKGYGTFKVPETYVIDRTGKIRDKIVGPENWDRRWLSRYLSLLTER